MKQIKTPIDKVSTKEFVQGNFFFALVSLGVALAIIALYIVFGVINHSWTDPLQIVLVVLGGVLLVLSIIMVIGYLNSINKMKDFHRIIVYNFSDDEITYDIYKENQVMASGKAPYIDVLEYKESKHFVYLRLRNNTWLVISKEEGLLDFIQSKGIEKHKFFSKR